ncbi:MAG: hypothetical protein IJE17_08655 [Clostridia bacterium]|nr:hypothetical protein [Clostridia bacterium]
MFYDAGGGFFVAKEAPSRTHPKKAALDDTGHPAILLNASGAKGMLWGLFSPKPRTRVIDPGLNSGTGNPYKQTFSR